MGYVEGQNLAIEYRSAENNHDRLPALAADVLRAQQKAMPVIGYLAGGSGGTFEVGLRQGLSETGYVEGQNLVIEHRYAGSRSVMGVEGEFVRPNPPTSSGRSLDADRPTLPALL
jgi:hypothetical protein